MKYTEAGQERHAKRMQEDPEYRKKILEYYREYNEVHRSGPREARQKDAGRPGV